MSMLDRAIRLVRAVRSTLDVAARCLAPPRGPVLLIGLDNGRLLDHLKKLFPQREIYSFDEKLRAFPELTPDPERLFIGDFRKTLPRARETLAGAAAVAVVQLAEPGVACRTPLSLPLLDALGELLL